MRLLFLIRQELIALIRALLFDLWQQIVAEVGARPVVEALAQAVRSVLCIEWLRLYATSI